MCQRTLKLFTSTVTNCLPKWLICTDQQYIAKSKNGQIYNHSTWTQIFFLLLLSLASPIYSRKCLIVQTLKVRYYGTVSENNGIWHKMFLPFLVGNYYFFRFYLFIHERQRERQRYRQREKLPCGEPDAGVDPRTLVSYTLSRRQTPNI